MSAVASLPVGQPATGRPRISLYALLVALSVFYLLPVFLLAITSLKPFEEVSLSRMWDLPRSLSVASFARAWEVMHASFLNSVLVVVPATALDLVATLA